MTADPGDDLRAALDRFQQQTSDQRGALEDLVRTLRSRLGVGTVRVGRRGIWGFGKLESAQFIIGDHSYRATLRGGKVGTEIGDSIGGVGLTPESVSWTDWVQRLTTDINTITQQNP